MTTGADTNGRARRHRPLVGRCLPAAMPGQGLGRIMLLAALCLIFGSLSAARGAEPTLDELTDAFVRITETAEFGNKPRGIAKWLRPITVAVVGRPEPDQASALDDLMRRLAEVPNLVLTRVAPIAAPRAGGDPLQPLDFTQNDGVFQILMHLPGHDWTVYTISGRADAVFTWRAHLTILFAPKPVFAQLARIQRFDPRLIADIDKGSTPCAANFHVDPTGNVVRYATVVLRTDLPDWARRRCLHEELIQVLGLMNDIKGSTITLFDDVPMKKRTEPTIHDWMFLDVLYDPRMTPGLHGAALRSRARELIAERLASATR